jgi:hypothetical protein
VVQAIRNVGEIKPTNCDSGSCTGATRDNMSNPNDGDNRCKSMSENRFFVRLGNYLDHDRSSSTISVPLRKSPTYIACGSVDPMRERTLVEEIRGECHEHRHRDVAETRKKDQVINHRHGSLRACVR